MPRYRSTIVTRSRDSVDDYRRERCNVTADTEHQARRKIIQQALAVGQTVDYFVYIYAAEEEPIE